MSRGAGPSFLPPVLTPAALAARLAPIEVTGNTTATIDRLHLVTATATLTDPTPVQGRGYEVIVRNGTATVGGTAYGVGLKIRRYYHSGAWSNQVEPSWGGTPTATRLTEWDATGNVINSAIVDGVSGGVATLSATLTADRTYTFPNAAITVAGSASALTSGRVPFVTTGGLLTDSSRLTFSNQTLVIGDGVSAGLPAYLFLNKIAGQDAGLVYRTGSVNRWQFYTTGAESGADAGSNFRLDAYTYAGGGIDSPLTITRASGGTITLARPTAITNTTASTSTITGSGTFAGGLGVAGQTTTTRFAVGANSISTTGAIASLSSNDGFTRLTGAAPDVQGIANSGTTARRIVLYCVNAVTLRHENGTAAAADRITSDTGADIAVAAGKTVELIYDPTSTRWRPIRY